MHLGGLGCASRGLGVCIHGVRGLHPWGEGSVSMGLGVCIQGG